MTPTTATLLTTNQRKSKVSSHRSKEVILSHTMARYSMQMNDPHPSHPCETNSVRTLLVYLSVRCATSCFRCTRVLAELIVGLFFRPISFTTQFTDTREVIPPPQPHSPPSRVPSHVFTDTPNLKVTTRVYKFFSAGKVSYMRRSHWTSETVERQTICPVQERD